MHRRYNITIRMPQSSSHAISHTQSLSDNWVRHDGWLLLLTTGLGSMLCSIACLPALFLGAFLCRILLVWTVVITFNKSKRHFCQNNDDSRQQIITKYSLLTFILLFSRCSFDVRPIESINIQTVLYQICCLRMDINAQVSNNTILSYNS